ncbi:hypothetical protein [Marilutibacter chinensis]|uniref:Lipoprotein n=1 Tax=Marilutibacter chinensis TaxID=2912247 RepID=A0ABS9HXU1_9GAMM|nr:hypothetical protein [Lysobacter chinensis]MCF7223603.1 hypothetical protein [Lysobacter chinensis]
MTGTVSQLKDLQLKSLQLKRTKSKDLESMDEKSKYPESKGTRRDGRRACLPASLLAVAALAMAGCAAEADGEVAASADMPTVYADARVETLVDGGNAGQAEYRAMLDACQQAGVSTMPLSAEDSALLGTGRLQWWVTPERIALRREYWDLANSGDVNQCHFTLAHSGVHEYFDAEQSVAYELPGMTVASDGPGDPDGLLRYAVDPELDTAAGAEGSAKMEVQGQPCREWSSSQGTVCKWTGGGEWGFQASPGYFQTTDSLSEHEIILRQEPANGNGVRITLSRFMLGEPWSRNALLPAEAEGQEGV